MYLARNQQPQRHMPPLPPATLIIDMRGKGNDLVQMLQVEVANLSEEMKMNQIDLWNRLSDFISYAVPDLLDDEDIKGLQAQAHPHNGESWLGANGNGHASNTTVAGGGHGLTGRVEPFDQASSFPPQYQANYQHPFEDLDQEEENTPFYRGFEVLIDEIDRIRNIRHNAVSDLGKSGTVGHNVKEPGVRVIFVADARQSNSLTTTAACAWYLKRFYRRLERPGEQTGRQIPVNVSVFCLNHQNMDQNVAPKSLIEGLQWDDSWEHVDALILSERYRQDIGRVDEDMQVLLAELVLYTLLIVSPALALMRPVPPKQKRDESIAENEKPVGLPPNTYLVGIASVENSTRWGYRLLNYGLAEQAIELLRDGDLGGEQATIRSVAETWFNSWRGLVRSALPENVPGDIPALGGITKAQKEAEPVGGVFSNSQLTLKLGERSARELETYLNAVCETYTASDTEQRSFRQLAQTRGVGLDTFFPLTLQTAVDSVPQIERAVDEWQDNEPESPLIKAQIAARRVLSHPSLFLGPRKAIPRAKLQLKELANVASERWNKSQKNPLNVKEKQQRLQDEGKTRINDFRDHVASWPLFAAGLNMKRLMARLNALFFLLLTAFIVTFAFAWIEELIRNQLTSFLPFVTTPILGFSAFTAFSLVFWIVGIAAMVVAFFVVDRLIFLDKRRTPLEVELTFCAVLFAIFLFGLGISLSYSPLADLNGDIILLTWFPTGLLPWVTALALAALLIILITETVYYFRWYAELKKERQAIADWIKAEHQRNIQEVINAITDALSFHLLERAGVIDNRGGNGLYHRRLDNLHNLLDTIYVSTTEHRRLAEGRLGSNLSDASLLMRQELISVPALKRGYKRLGMEMEFKRDELKELAETLLRTMGQESPAEIERSMRERAPHSGDREQYYVQILMEALTAVALRFAIFVPTFDLLTPLEERYAELDSQVTNQLASLQPLVDMLESKVGAADLDTRDGSKERTNAREYDVEVAVQALAAWGQMLWENRDVELSNVLAPGGVIVRLIHDRHNPQTVKETLGIRTSPSGRTKKTGPYDDLYLFVSFSPDSRRFLKDFLPDSYLAEYPDNERLVLMHIEYYIAQPMIRKIKAPDAQAKTVDSASASQAFSSQAGAFGDNDDDDASHANGDQMPGGRNDMGNGKAAGGNGGMSTVVDGSTEDTDDEEYEYEEE